MKRLATTIGVLGLTAQAHAYVLYTSPKFPSVPLRWDSRTTGFVMDNAAPGEVSLDGAHTAVASSFEVWSALTCGAESVPWSFPDGGLVAGRTVGFDQNNLDNNENLVTWVQSKWAHERAVVALTSLTYDLYSGRIVDADIEVNDQGFKFSTNPATNEMDVMNTFVHEIGHFVGLDHSTQTSATMYASAPVHETQKRDLTQDDVDGYCALYSASAKPWPVINGPLTSDSPADCTEEVEGTQTTITCGDAVTSSSCSTGPLGRHGSLAGLGGLLVLLAGGLWRRRRARALAPIRLVPLKHERRDP